MLTIKRNNTLVSRFQRLLSHCQKYDRQYFIPSSVKLNSKLKRLIDSQQYKEALDLFDQRFEICTDFSIVMALKACTIMQDYQRGLSIQQKLSSDSLENEYVQTGLIRFYIKCHDVKNAMRLFSHTKHKSNHMYTAIFKGLISSGMHTMALDLLDEMIIEPDNFTLTISFNVCGEINNDRAKDIGQRLIEKVIQYDQTDDIMLNAATHMLIRFGNIEVAAQIFKMIKQKNTVVYGAMMKGYVDHGMAEKALDLFEQMNVKANNVIYTIAFRACAVLSNDRAMHVGKKLIDQIAHLHSNDNIVLTSAISMLMKHGNIQDAERIFNLIEHKNVITYATMMKGYILNRMAEKALDLFEQTNSEASEMIYAHVFSACAQLSNERARTIGRRLLFETVDQSPVSDIVLTSAIHMTMKFGDIQKAEQLFELTKKKNAFTYSTLMQGYIENGMPEKALDLFQHIDVPLDNTMRTIIFNACAQLSNDRSVKIGKQLIDEIFQTRQIDDIVLTSALQMLVKHGDIQHAERIFNLIVEKNTVAYASLMKSYISNGMIEKVLDTFERMNTKPNDAVYTIVFTACAQLLNDRAKAIVKNLINDISDKTEQDITMLNSALHVLLKFSDIECAEHFFNSIKRKNTSTYGTLMNGYNMNGQPYKCLKVFEDMKELDLIPDEIIWTILIGACAQTGLVRRCEYIVEQIPLNIRTQKQVQNALIDMWAKCGSIEKAQQVFQSVVERNTVTYTAMINGYGLNGMGLEAFELYERTPKNLRNEVTHICVLNACSHSGLLQEARQVISEISAKTERITAAMIDCLSRLFLFDEAQKLIEEYEKMHSPNFVMYMSLLSAARNSRNGDLSEKIFNRMKSLFPENKEGLLSGAILVSNIYSSFGNYQQAHEFRLRHKKEFRTRVPPGSSWTDLNGEIVEFNAHDHKHPSMHEIHDEIHRLTAELIEHGYQFDPTCITRSLNEGETIESVLCGHSEKIAVAFNFIQKPIPDFIQVVKNLRVCGDCHRFLKLLAKVRQRNIIVRDAHRIHHFQCNGQCSCQDHF